MEDLVLCVTLDMIFYFYGYGFYILLVYALINKNIGIGEKK